MRSRFLDQWRGPQTVCLVALRGALLAVLLAGLPGCGDEHPPLSGAWSGTFTQESQERSGTIRLTLSESDSSLGGRWDVEFPPDLGYGGVVEGSVSGSAVRAHLLPDDPEICPYEWKPTAGADRISGRYAAFDCRVEIVGEIDVRRR